MFFRSGVGPYREPIDLITAIWDHLGQRASNSVVAAGLQDSASLQDLCLFKLVKSTNFCSNASQVLEIRGHDSAAAYFKKHSQMGKIPTGFKSIFSFEMFIRLPAMYQFYMPEKLNLSRVETKEIKSGGMFGTVPVVTCAEAYRTIDSCDFYAVRIFSCFPLKKSSLLDLLTYALECTIIYTLLIRPAEDLEQCVMCEVSCRLDTRMSFSAKGDTITVLGSSDQQESCLLHPNFALADLQDIESLVQGVGDCLSRPLTSLRQRCTKVLREICDGDNVKKIPNSRIHKSCYCHKCYLLRLLM